MAVCQRNLKFQSPEGHEVLGHTAASLVFTNVKMKRVLSGDLFLLFKKESDQFVLQLYDAKFMVLKWSRNLTKENTPHMTYPWFYEFELPDGEKHFKEALDFGLGERPAEFNEVLHSTILKLRQEPITPSCATLPRPRQSSAPIRPQVPKRILQPTISAPVICRARMQ
uniref:uncharacterized protein isoform X2 n=1 Tax=Myxine glutinosa TaxID=7769 RepID=UPI00358EBA8A